MSLTQEREARKRVLLAQKEIREIRRRLTATIPNPFHIIPPLYYEIIEGPDGKKQKLRLVCYNDDAEDQFALDITTPQERLVELRFFTSARDSTTLSSANLRQIQNELIPASTQAIERVEFDERELGHLASLCFFSQAEFRPRLQLYLEHFDITLSILDAIGEIKTEIVIPLTKLGSILGYK